MRGNGGGRGATPAGRGIGQPSANSGALLRGGRPVADTEVVSGGGRRYGDIVDSDFVHDEIKALAASAKQHIIRSRVPQEEDGLLEAIQQFGLAPGSRQMMDMEMAAAQRAQSSGLYVSFRYEGPGKHNGEDCIRVGPKHKCFCGHPLDEHKMGGKRPTMACETCACTKYAFIPNRPEEIGEAWLPRRKGFDITAWSPKCRCGHGSTDHGATRPMSCRKCGCCAFQSHFLCFVCDGKWEDHMTVVETEAERAAQGKTVGEAYEPLSDNPQFKSLVFPNGQRHPLGEGAPVPSLYAPPQPRKAQPKARPALPPPPAHQPAPAPTQPPAPPPAAPCPSCGAAPRPAARFCAKCGVPLTELGAMRLRDAGPTK